MDENSIQMLRFDDIRMKDISIEAGNVYSFPVHGHLYYEILIYDSFDGEITINEKVFSTALPTAVLISPNDFHSINVNNGGAAGYYKLKIRSEVMEFFSDQSFETVITQNAAVVNFLKELCTVIATERTDFEYFKACARVIALTLRKCPDKIRSVDTNNSLVKKAADIINRSFHLPITLQSVAAELHVSPQYLAGLFSQHTEGAFNDYLSNRRLTYACLLLSGGCNVTETCYQSGYRNLSYFIRSFKKKYGLSPTQYLKSKEGE